MALASNLVTDRSYPVRSGEFAGHRVVIVNSTPVPDTEPNRRKVLVRVLRDGAVGEEVYLLPRLIDDGVPTAAERRALAEQHRAVEYVPTDQPHLLLPPRPAEYAHVTPEQAVAAVSIARQHVEAAQAQLVAAVTAMVQAEALLETFSEGA